MFSPIKHWQLWCPTFISSSFVVSVLGTAVAPVCAAGGRTVSTAWWPAASRTRRWAVRLWPSCCRGSCGAKSRGTCRCDVTLPRFTCSTCNSRAPASSRSKLCRPPHMTNHWIAGRYRFILILCYLSVLIFDYVRRVGLVVLTPRSRARHAIFKLRWPHFFTLLRPPQPFNWSAGW